MSKPRKYRSVKTLLKAFKESRVSHDEFLKQAPGLPAEPPKPKRKKRKS